VSSPLQGEIHWADPEPIRGREQAKARPFLVVSVDSMNQSPIALALAVPLTTVDRRSPLHVEIVPPEGGLGTRSFAMPEQLRVMSTERVSRKVGSVRPTTLREVLRRCRLLLRDPR